MFNIITCEVIFYCVVVLLLVRGIEELFKSKEAVEYSSHVLSTSIYSSTLLSIKISQPLLTFLCDPELGELPSPVGGHVLRNMPKGWMRYSQLY